MAYGKEYRERVLAYLRDGHTHRGTAAVFGISTTTLTRWKDMQKRGEGLECKVRNRKPKKIDPEKLRAYVQAHPDAYLAEIAAEFGCASSSVSEALQKLGLRRKKRR